MSETCQSRTRCKRVVRLGEKSDLPIFVLLASAPSSLASGNAEGGFRWLPGHRSTPRRPALRLRGWRKTLNDLPVVPVNRSDRVAPLQTPCWMISDMSDISKKCCRARPRSDRFTGDNRADHSGFSAIRATQRWPARGAAVTWEPAEPAFCISEASELGADARAQILAVGLFAQPNTACSEFGFWTFQTCR